MPMKSIRLALGFVACLAVVGCEEGGAGGGASDTSGGTDGGSVDDGSTSGGSEEGGSEGGTGAGGGGNPGLDEVEAACEADCEAQFATECPPTNQNVLTCKLNCAVATVQLGDFCLGEYTDVIRCRADGGYDCLNDYPTPRSTCAVENAAYAECTTDLGCKRYCADAVDAGCGGASFDACLDACLAEKAAAPEYCGIYIDQVRLCEAQSGLECVGGQPMTTGDCTYAITNVGDCLFDETEDPCQGYCYVADELACGTDCTTDCASRIADPTCGQAFASLVDCELRHGDFECADGRLIGIDICDHENMQYEMCLAG